MAHPSKIRQVVHPTRATLKTEEILRGMGFYNLSPTESGADEVKFSAWNKFTGVPLPPPVPPVLQAEDIRGRRLFNGPISAEEMLTAPGVTTPRKRPGYRRD